MKQQSNHIDKMLSAKSKVLEIPQLDLEPCSLWISSIHLWSTDQIILVIFIVEYINVLVKL